MESMVEWVKELYQVINESKQKIRELKEENKKLTEEVAKEGEGMEYLRMQRDGLHVCAGLPYASELWIEGNLLKFYIKDKDRDIKMLIEIEHTDKFNAIKTIRDILARIELGDYEVLN